MRFFLFVLLFLSTTISAQTIIKGNVVDASNKHLIDFFNVALINSKDSSVIKSGNFMNGSFILETSPMDSTLIKLSSFGYKSLFIAMNNRKTELFDIGTQQMEIANYNLKEVVVKAGLPKIIHKDDRMIVDIQNTSLRDAGNALNTLKRTPFVIVDNVTGDIYVAGKGNAIILVDNRKITNTKELELLNSQNIKQVDIIENPSAKYEAEGHSVINIITNRPKDQGTNISVQNLLSVGRHVSNQTMGDISYSLSKLLFYGQYSYSGNNNEGFNSSVNKFIKDNYSFVSTEHNTKNIYHAKTNEYTLGINYTPTEHHLLSMKLDGSFGKSSNNTVNLTDIVKNGITYPTNFLYSDGNQIPKNYNVNLTYAFNKNEYEISLIGDYTYYKNTSNTDLLETDLNSSYQNNMLNGSAMTYHLYSFQSDVKIPLKKIKSNLEFGGRYSSIKSDNDNRFLENISNTWVVDSIFTSNEAFEEKIVGAYILFSGSLNKQWRFSTGLRYENTSNKSVWNSVTDSTYAISTNNFFPSMFLGYNANANLLFKLSYSRRINRPSYASLNNSVWYLNSYSTRQGNPFLQPTLYNTLSLSSKYKSFNATINLSYIENPTDLIYFNDKLILEKNVVRYANTVNRWSYGFNLSYSYGYKFWSIQPFFSLTYMDRSIIDDGVKYTTNYPATYLRLNNQFVLTKTSSIDFDAAYNRPAHSFKQFNEQFIFSTVWRKKMIADKLILQLGYNFTPTKWNQFMNYSYKYIDFTWDGDDRSMLTISLKYNIHQSKKQFQSKSSNSEEQRRM
jgi:iron complex outermembrane recepter protein